VFSISMLSVVMLSHRQTEGCHPLVLNVTILIVVMLNVVMNSVFPPLSGSAISQ
jgi:hypothetical protein